MLAEQSMELDALNKQAVQARELRDDLNSEQKLIERQRELDDRKRAAESDLLRFSDHRLALPFAMISIAWMERYCQFMSRRKDSLLRWNPNAGHGAGGKQRNYCGHRVFQCPDR